VPLAFARHVYLYSATLISPGPRRRTRLSPSQSPDRRYSARSADRSTRHACCRRQFQLAGVARPTWLPLGCQGHFFSFAVCCFAGGFARDPRLSTGSGALQPRVESRTPPESRRDRTSFRPVEWRRFRPLDRVIRDQRTPGPCAPVPAWQAWRRGLTARRGASARIAPGATSCAPACRRRASPAATVPASLRRGQPECRAFLPRGAARRGARGRFPGRT